MKFTDGYWMLQSGSEQYNAIHVYRHTYKDNVLTLYCPFKQVITRGDTLNLGMITIEISSPYDNIISIKAYHHIGGSSKEPKFDLNMMATNSTCIESEDTIEYSNHKAKVIVHKNPYSIEFYYDGVYKTRSDVKSLGYVLMNNKAYMKEELQLSIHEHVYGLGERFTDFVKNGQVVDIDQKDGGTGSEQSYKNIPFYITTKGYGIFMNTSGKVSLEIASEKVSAVQFSLESECLEYMFIGGNSMKEVLVNYTNITGKPTLPPEWSFGLWLSTSFLTDYDEDTVNSFIDGMIERDIPLDVFHFDCCWMEEFEWCNFEWNKEMFPNPRKMIERIHSKGIKVCVWINPYIGQKSKLFKEAMEHNYMLRKQDGSVWQWDMWQAGNGYVDFTSSEATNWYLSYLENLLDMGVDCFKTDFGERIPEDVVYSDGSDPVLMHNYYTYLFNKAVFDLLERKRGKGEACVFARSATATCQKFPVHWGGDCVSKYTSMAESLRGGLSFVMSGFGFWSNDIGGFEDGCEADLYKRWTQFGLLNTHSRYHGSGQYKVPWFYGEESVDVCRKFTKLKVSLMPYLYKEARDTSITGIPMMRPLVLEYEKDLITHHIDTQYMLGSKLMVCPIFNDQGICEFYVPEGKWTNILTNKVYEGNRYYTEQFDYMHMPLLVKENSILVTRDNQTSASYNYLEDVTIYLYEVNSNIKEEIYYKDNKGIVEVIVEEGNMKVSIDGFSGKCRVVMNNKVYDIKDHIII